MSSDFREEVKQWILETKSNVSAKSIDFDTNIIEERVISSVQIADLILFLEYLRSSPVDVQRIKPGAFSSINAIYESFLADVDSSCV